MHFNLLYLGFLSVISLSVTVKGFLFDQIGQHNNVNGSSSTGHCVSLSEFEATKNALQRENDALRHKLQQNQIDFEKAFNELTSQIQKRFQYQKLINNALNATENSEIKNDFRELEMNNSMLQQNFKDLHGYCSAMDHDGMSLKETVKPLVAKISALGEIEAVKQLETLHSVVQRLQTIESKIETVNMNEQARRHDFLALHNETSVNSRNMATLQKTVTLTACDTGHNYPIDAVIKFTTIKYRNGLENITVSNFIKSGKFMFESAGLYFVDVTLLSYTSSGRYALYKNGKYFTHSYISGDDKYQSASMINSLKFQVNDTIWIQSFRAGLNVDAEGSCITIIKLK